MEGQTAVHSTFVIERSYPKPPERVFAAFADAAMKRRWYAEGENKEVEEFAMDFRVGGTERARYRYNGPPLQGVVLTSEANFLAIVPNRRVVSSSTMNLGEQRISAALLTFELLPTDKGTSLIFTYQGAFFEGADGPQIREAGWVKLLDRLTAELTR